MEFKELKRPKQPFKQRFLDWLDHKTYSMRRSLKHLYQYVTRGWPDSDTWNLDYKIAKFILPRLQRFQQLRNGYPPDLTSEEWDSILQDMEYAFLVCIVEGKGDLNDDAVDWDTVQRGLENFGKYFRDLWW